MRRWMCCSTASASRRSARILRRMARKFSTRRDLIVAPGFIDLHCHLREPGQEMSETIETGTRAAARGGFTAVCRMPNTQPVNDSASVTRGIVERAAAAASVRVWPIGAASVGSKGEALAEIAAMKNAGIVAVSDDGKPIAHARLMRQVMDYCRALDLAGDRSLRGCVALRRRSDARRSAINRSGLKGIPSQSESICVGRDVEVAGADRRAAAHRAHVDAGFARIRALGEKDGPARDLRSDAASLHADRRRCADTTRTTR